MSNSPLATYWNWSPNNSGTRTNPINIITIHMVVGQASVEALGNLFANPARQASSTYGVGYDGKIGQYVNESDRPWTSSSSWNDNRAVTIETASDTEYPYAVNNAAFESLIKLCADICKRNGKTKMVWYPTWDEFEVNYNKEEKTMYMTLHKWFAATSCPGAFLENRMGEIAKRVNAMIEPKPKKTYTDVTPDMSSYRAIMWATEQGLYQGYKDGTFRPKEPLTREQDCVVRWREAGRP